MGIIVEIKDQKFFLSKLKKFSKMVNDSGLKREMKQRQEYEKPSERKRRKQREAIRKARKKLAKKRKEDFKKRQYRGH